VSSVVSFSHIGWIAILVLIVLGIMSIISWAIIFYKWILFNRLIRKDKAFSPPLSSLLPLSEYSLFSFLVSS